MRKKIIGSSWKIHINSIGDGVRLASRIKELVGQVDAVEIFILPSFPMIGDVADILKGSTIGWGAQNICFEEKGAFTGEVPAQMLKDLHCSYAEIGHAERRELFNETDEIVNRKVSLAFEYGLTPVVCIGETQKDKDHANTEMRLKTQVLWALKGLEAADIKRVIFAYEPVWAIGKQAAADPAYVNRMHSYIRRVITDEYGGEIADFVRVIYGGSVSPESAVPLLKCPDVDGLFLGRFALKAENFKKIVDTALESIK